MELRFRTSNSMTNTVLFDYNRRNLFPFTLTRPVADLRTGILTNRQHWELVLEQNVSFFTEDYLNKKFPVWQEKENLFINGSMIPSVDFVEAAGNLLLGQRLVQNGIPLAAFAEGWPDPTSPYGRFRDIEYNGKLTFINHPWDLFILNDEILRQQFEVVTENKKSRVLSGTNQVMAPENIFVEDGAKVEFSIINAAGGPVYIGKNVEIMEGSMIRGPVAICENATVKMGAKIYGATTIGPYCKVGGEISNSVIFGYSNKAHDGFIGNSVLGEWCNLGADTNTSNLKNNYSNVKVYNYKTDSLQDSGLTFCGLFMGDHSKSGINTMFNTGTVVGVSANIFGTGFPPKYIPSFTWGGFEPFEPYDLQKAAIVAKAVFSRRKMLFDATEESILKAVNELTKSDATVK